MKKRRLHLYTAAMLFACTYSLHGQTTYTDGVFMLNEDWYGHNNSTLNFIRPDHPTDPFEYYIIQNNESNAGQSLGATAQFGAVYGDYLFIISKQDQDAGDGLSPGESAETRQGKRSVHRRRAQFRGRRRDERICRHIERHLYPQLLPVRDYGTHRGYGEPAHHGRRGQRRRRGTALPEPNWHDAAYGRLCICHTTGQGGLGDRPADGQNHTHREGMFQHHDAKQGRRHLGGTQHQHGLSALPLRQHGVER